MHVFNLDIKKYIVYINNFTYNSETIWDSLQTSLKTNSKSAAE